MIRRGAPLALTLALAGAALPVAAQDIGAVGAVNQRTTGQPPALPAPRQLSIADRVVRNERVVAGPDGAAQLMFLDQTTLSVGPNSDVVLDEYVYDPDAGTGAMAFSIARGALRFIGGGISKSSEVEATVPGAVIGLRGAIANLRVEGERTEFVFLAGQSGRIAVGDETLTISRPGGRAVIERGPDGAFSAVYTGVASPEQTAAMFASVVSPGDGGSRVGGVGPDAHVLDAAFAVGGTTAPVVSTSGELQQIDASVQDIFTAGDLALAAQSAFATIPVTGGFIPDPGPIIGDTTILLPLSFIVYDFSTVDGDRVRVSVFDRTGLVFEVPDLTMTGPRDAQVFTPEAVAGRIDLRIEALNTGEFCCNTGRIDVLSEVLSGDASAQFNLLAPGDSGTLVIDARPSVGAGL